MYRNPRFQKRCRTTMEVELSKRRGHLADYLDDYRRVLDVIYNTILPRMTDEDASVFAVRYAPRARVLSIGIGWKVSDDFPRSSGFFSLWRGGIYYASGDIRTWPKTTLLVEPSRSIQNMHDDEIVERILTCIGAPWANRFTVPPEAGAIRHDARRLLHLIETINSVAPPQRASEVNDLRARIKDFASSCGV
jgi:hypothetical protein